MRVDVARGDIVRSVVAGGALLAGLSFAAPVPADAPDPGMLYHHHCAMCHGVGRLGGIGPALLPGNLSRLERDEAVAVIRDGRPATQMPAYEALLGAEEIAALAEWIYVPPEVEPSWSDQDILASRVVSHSAGSLADEPVFEVEDLLNLFIVVELGDHHVSLVDGDTFERIDRFPSRYALHGGPKFSPDGRYVYFGSRDGWVTKYDIYHLAVTAEVRAGINMRNIAVSADGRYVLAGNYLPHSLVLLDARDLELIATIPVEGRDGGTSRVSAVYAAPPRDSFVVALRDIPEVWEIRWPEAPIEGDEALAGGFSLHRLQVPDYLDDFFFDPEYRYVVGAARGGKGARSSISTRRSRSPTCRWRACRISARASPGSGRGAASWRSRTSTRAWCRSSTWATGRRSPTSRPTVPASSCAATRTRPTPGWTSSPAPIMTACTSSTSGRSRSPRR